MDVKWFQRRKKERKLTDSQIADAVGRDRSLMNKVLSGKAAFQIEFLIPLAEVLGTSKEELLFRFGVLDRIVPDSPESPPAPSIDQLKHMLADALFGVPPGTPLLEYPNLAAPELHEQLGLYLAGALSNQTDEATAQPSTAQPDPVRPSVSLDSARK